MAPAHDVVPMTDTVHYTRGTDSSGTFQGAGGIGGLLGRANGYSSGTWSTHNYYHADANGNVTYIVNSSQTVAATYKYDPFGRTISSSGTLASANTMRFSSKEIHVNSGMYYYGYRFYDPNIQRWLNRDPIGIKADHNLYRFVQNRVTNFIDPLGLAFFDCSDPQRGGYTACNGKGGWETTNCKPNSPEAECIDAHEQQHLRDFEKDFPNACKDKPKDWTPLDDPQYDRYGCEAEVRGYEKGRDCLDNLLRCRAWDPATKAHLELQRYAADISARRYGDIEWCMENKGRNRERKPVNIDETK